jgi:hypothetical protein
MGEIVKVEPRSLVYLYPFIRDTFVWMGEENYKLAEKLARGIEIRGIYKIQLTPSFVLVPQYRYTSTALKTLGFDVKYDSIIKLENLSTFTVQKVPDDLDYRINMLLDTSYDYNYNDWVVRLWKLEVEIKPKIRDSRSPLYNWIFLNQDVERIDLEKVLKTVNWAQGKLYSKFSSRMNSSVVDRIQFLERSLFILLNFLYTIYTDTFSKEDPEHILFNPFVDTLRSYGNTFEDLLFTIKELTILVG